MAAAARLAALRLRGPSVVLAGLVAILSVVGLAILERADAPSRAADYTLFGAVFGWTLPLLAYVVTGRALGGARLDHALLPISRAGGDRRGAALGLLLCTAVVVALGSALLAAVGVLVARARLDSAALGDAATSSAIAAVGGAVYVAWFGLGSLFGRAGAGRAACLVIDWVLGTGHTFAAVAWPRAHLVSLIGGTPVLDLSATQSWTALSLLASTYLALILVRLPR